MAILVTKRLYSRLMYRMDDEFIMVLLIAAVIGIVINIFYLLTLNNTLKLVKAGNRQMEPGQVWLILIPFFGLVWQFIVVQKIADSLKAEFADRNISVGDERPGYNIGLAYCILFCCSIVPVLGGLASIGGLVCWIIYWVKINEFKARLGGPRGNDEILD